MFSHPCGSLDQLTYALPHATGVAGVAALFSLSVGFLSPAAHLGVRTPPPFARSNGANYFLKARIVECGFPLRTYRSIDRVEVQYSPCGHYSRERRRDAEIVSSSHFARR
jgi:hypothetical protein